MNPPEVDEEACELIAPDILAKDMVRAYASEEEARQEMLNDPDTDKLKVIVPDDVGYETYIKLLMLDLRNEVRGTPTPYQVERMKYLEGCLARVP